MGTPQNEQGRHDWEFAQHEVLISDGFWLFDTPCTQEMWEAVTGKTPSQFKGDRRPVEQVSWDDCQEFLTQLNAGLPGLNLELPREEQWEYVCRAGTETPIWNSSTQFNDEAHAEALDRIAWYSANSERQTHAVGLKAANPWGLYDMLGNVWEWCADNWRVAYDADDASAGRVIRGGSWNDAARCVRAAYRSSWRPSPRSLYLGFRCSSSVSSVAEPGEVRSERAVRGRRPKAELAGDSEPAPPPTDPASVDP